ncbi:hypothetical protein CC1G_06153 [Coprinopsis cinerea okayama7|uniref:Helicase C-terminal domain-containing protein n=1 Tax=Coprinopsis cinerea (strain Okayama-7 / 130 / ATCC MYA-4618 / FGSC 9003) TaxID=240176 RepID=A8PAC8_COPC7|nr:hypothetical protein CC1G_06153 [Coprinopsis cinerea okayama7\|eukprot:XP_001839963.1 hypothetical protein CC1G_06153 [Coprinopsis cinerea okayama7\
MVAISATLPTIYRNSLTALSGLKPNYRLINLGNFRPELSVIIKNMEYDMSTFKDLEFLFTWSIDPRHPATIPSCIIYTDDIDRLTAMFWWFRGKLREQGLPIHWVDLIHAGLSRHHQEASTRRFRDGQTRIWLGTEKIGPGVDVAHVTLVIQYGCRGLTLVGWEQRRGRGARSTGTYAIGVLLVEKSMADGQLTVASPGYEDPGLLQLVRSPPTTCYEQIVLYLLEDPRHNPDLRCGTRCSNCKPELIALVRSYTWISVDPGTSRAMASASAALAAPTAAQIAATLARLKEWRFRHWEESWKEQWFSYGPDDLIDDRDLQSLVKSIHNITTLDDIYQRTQIPHFEEIAPRLLLEIENIRRNMYGELAVTAHASTPALEQPQGPQPSPNLQEPRYAQIRWVDTVDTQVEPTPAHPRIISPSIQAAPSKPTRNQFRMHQLYPGEQVLSFNTP